MSLDGTRLARVMAGRSISEEKLAELSGYRPESIKRFLASPSSAPSAFVLVAEVVLKLKPGQLHAADNKPSPGAPKR
ncbi:hypothetical protein F0U61_32485 [Archangium violaceum]|uniref:hypothetical protein n=1 Tax=Archangium violaceum TaxID=83451 RepID=UPI002B2FF837|nr:hypothetical protein F0U61_32485 [Archangium violaceum]